MHFDDIYVAFNIFFSTIGSIASLINIILIYRTNRWKGHILLVLLMSYFQLIYDISFPLSTLPTEPNVEAVALMFQIFSGNASCIASNWIAFVACYIVYLRRSFNITDKYYLILATCLIPAIGNALVFLIATFPPQTENEDVSYFSLEYIYGTIRMASICLNFLFIAASFHKVLKISPSNRMRTEQDIAIYTVIGRMVYYPTVQLICRSAIMWYEFNYGGNISTSDADTTKEISLFLVIFLTPMMGVGYLIIYIIMQPFGYENFISFLKCQSFDIEQHEKKLKEEEIRKKKAMGQTSKDIAIKISFSSMEDALSSPDYDPHYQQTTITNKSQAQETLEKDTDKTNSADSSEKKNKPKHDIINDPFTRDSTMNGTAEGSLDPIHENPRSSSFIAGLVERGSNTLRSLWIHEPSMYARDDEDLLMLVDCNVAHQQRNEDFDGVGDNPSIASSGSRSSTLQMSFVGSSNNSTVNRSSSSVPARTSENLSSSNSSSISSHTNTHYAGRMTIMNPIREVSREIDGDSRVNSVA